MGKDLRPFASDLTFLPITALSHVRTRKTVNHKRAGLIDDPQIQTFGFF
jgi:hypothetical protein